MAFEANLWCYPWDLEDEGIDRALDVIQGELGATGISVATVYHSVDHLRSHPHAPPGWFRSAGGMQFQPHASLYRGTRARPVVAEWLRTRNPLAAISEACAKRGLALRGWTVCCHGSAMAAKNPALAMKDIFGGASPAWLCPLNPDVQENLRAVVEDLTHSYRFDAIELEACGFPASCHSHGHEKVGVDPGPVGRLLLTLCLCESCRQAASQAGLDVAAVERSAKTDLERILRGEAETPMPDLDEYVTTRPPLRAFLAWRAKGVADLVSRLRPACAAKLLAMRAGDATTTGTDPRQIAANCDGLLALGYGADEAGIERLVKQAADETGSPQRVWLGLDVTGHRTKDSASLVRHVGCAARLGVAGVSFYNYGIIPPGRLPWVQQAIRYGRREG